LYQALGDCATTGPRCPERAQKDPIPPMTTRWVPAARFARPVTSWGMA